MSKTHGYKCTDEHAMHITGHTNPSSLNKYRTIKENRKKEISQILSTTTDKGNNKFTKLRTILQRESQNS